MADPKTPDAGKALTLAEAAKLFKLKADQVLAFRDYGTHVVVVTVDGKKLSNAPAEA